MKKKIISILLACFIFVSSSVSCFAYEKNNIRFADGGFITAPMLGVVATVLVGSGIIINSSDNIIDVGMAFYDNYKDNWEVVNSVFNSCVSIGKDKIVTVGSEFLNYIKDFAFNNFGSDSGKLIAGYLSGIPIYYHYNVDGVYALENGIKYKFDNDGDIFYLNSTGSVYIKLDGKYTDLYVNGVRIASVLTQGGKEGAVLFYKTSSGGYRCFIECINEYGTRIDLSSVFSELGFLPIEFDGVLNWDNNICPNEKGDLSISVPSDLNSLVGNGVDVFNPSYDLPIDGVISVPNVSNPSIDIDNSVSIPSTGTNDGVVEGNPNFDFSFPSFGDSINFEPLYAAGITEKFPFSLPWDIQRIIGVFDVSPVAPRFTVPLLSEKIELDLTRFDELANIVRFFVLIGFIACLIFISTRLMG